MTPNISLVSLLVHDYDDALQFFLNALQFELRADTPMGNGKRWVVVAPRKSNGAALLLAQASTPEQSARVGDQTGGRVFMFLETDDFAAEHARMLECGVRFVEQPRHEAYGTVAVFCDLYGNKWDLLQPSAAL